MNLNHVLTKEIFIHNLSLFLRKSTIRFFLALFFWVLWMSFTSFSKGYSQTQLFGLTSEWTTDTIGSIFSYTPSTGVYTTKMVFKQYAKASEPMANLTEGPNGKLYGMSAVGGYAGGGNIFEWDPVTNAYSEKYSFYYNPNTPSGHFPLGSLTYQGGLLYGMTRYGGSNNKGVIFEWNPTTNVYTKRMDFGGLNGEEPYGDLTYYNGKFYGMTRKGGTNGLGVIFEWNPATGIFTKKIDLNWTIGAYPQGNLTFLNGSFYGMTTSGGQYYNGSYGGVIFEWNPTTNVYTNKIALDSIGGNVPYGSLATVNGKFYGMTSEGGTNDLGVIFEWNPTTNVYSKKQDFNGINGALPRGTLSLRNGKFYGITYQGGAAYIPVLYYGEGVIFEWDPATNIYSKKFDMVSSEGYFCFGSLVLSGNKYYGMTKFGGGANKGVIFEWDPTLNVYARKIDLSAFPFGAYPLGDLTLRNNILYGTSKAAGAFNKGTLFEFNPQTNTFYNKISFNGLNGATPFTSPMYYAGKYYGTTAYGGVNNKGVIYEWEPATNVYTQKIDFNGTNGFQPRGQLIEYNGKLYGVTIEGGTYNEGTLYEWDPTTNTLTTKYHFNTGSNGRRPVGNLLNVGGRFYGMTSTGGSVGQEGVIFEWNPATNGYTKKIDLTIGKAPFGSLIEVNGLVYGMTAEGGLNNGGILFEWNPQTNVITKKIDFWNYSPAPTGTLLYSGGEFYGTTTGDPNSFGILFKWNASTNVFTVLDEFDPLLRGTLPEYGKLLEFTPCASPPPAPASTTPGGNLSICQGNTTTLSASGSGTIEWYDAPTGGNFLGAGNVFNTSILNNNTTFYAEDYTCLTSSRTAISVTVLPPTPTPSVLQNGNVLSTGINYASYQWLINGQVINGANALNYTPTTTGNYSVMVTGNGGCQTASASVQIVIDGLNSSFVFNTGMTNCQQATFTNTSTGVSGGTPTYSWNFGNGNTFMGTTPPVQTFTGAGPFNVCLTTTLNGIPDTECKSVILGPCTRNTPDLNVIVQGSKITMGLNGSANSAYTYSWYVNNTLYATVANPAQYTTPGAGTYSVCLKTKYTQCGTACCTQMCKDVNVANPCSGLSAVNLTFAPSSSVSKQGTLSTTPTSTTYTRIWKIYDNNNNQIYTTTGTGASISYTFPSFGDYKICVDFSVSSNNGSCTRSICKNIKIEPLSGLGNLRFRYINASNTPTLVSFLPSLNPTNLSLNWDFGDGNTGTSSGTATVTHTYSGTGTYNVCVSASDPNNSANNYGTFCHNVKVQAPASSLCNGATGSCTINPSLKVDVSNGTLAIQNLNSSNPIYAYSWFINNVFYSTAFNPPAYTAPSPGTYNVCLKMIYTQSGNSCCKQTCLEAIVANPCSALASAINYTYTYHPSVANQATMIASPVGTGFSYTWKIYNSSNVLVHTHTSNSNQYTYAFPLTGNYNVCMEINAGNVNGNCNRTICKTMKVEPLITFTSSLYKYKHNSFEVNKVEFTPILSVVNGTSSPILWNYGDGSYSTSIGTGTNTHIFNANGIYNVCMTAIENNNPNSKSTYCQNIKIATNTGTTPCIAPFRLPDLEESIENLAFNEATPFLLYPNPSELGYVYLASQEEIPSGSNTEVMDINGRIVYRNTIQTETKRIQIPLESLPSGTYLIRIVYPDGKVYFQEKIAVF